MADPKKRDPFTLGNILRDKYDLDTVEFESLPEDRQELSHILKNKMLVLENFNESIL